jgi:hypothetical protein
VLIFTAISVSIVAYSGIRRRRQIQYVCSQSALLVRSMRKEFRHLECEPRLMAPEHAKEVSVES